MKIVVLSALSLLAIVSIILWSIIGQSPPALLEFTGLSTSAHVWPALLPLIGMVTGACLVAIAWMVVHWRSPGIDQNGTQSELIAGSGVYPAWHPLFLGVLLGACSILMVFGVLSKEVPASRAAVALVLAAMTFLASANLVEALRRGQAIEFNSYWGGLGGGLGGWRLSPATTALMLTLVFLSATVFAVTGSGHDNPRLSSTPPPTNSSSDTEGATDKKGESKGNVQDQHTTTNSVETNTQDDEDEIANAAALGRAAANKVKQ